MCVLLLLVFNSWRAQHSSLHPLQALCAHLAPVSRHAVYIKVIHEQSLCLFAQSLGADDPLREYSWVLRTEQQPNSRYPILARRRCEESGACGLLNSVEFLLLVEVENANIAPAVHQMGAFWVVCKKNVGLYDTETEQQEGAGRTNGVPCPKMSSMGSNARPATGLRTSQPSSYPSASQSEDVRISNSSSSKT